MATSDSRHCYPLWNTVCGMISSDGMHINCCCPLQHAWLCTVTGMLKLLFCEEKKKKHVDIVLSLLPLCCITQKSYLTLFISSRLKIHISWTFYTYTGICILSTFLNQKKLCNVFSHFDHNTKSIKLCSICIYVVFSNEIKTYYVNLSSWF